jgi:hypothetical protein
MLLRLYRGISVDAERGEDIKATILRQGIIGTEAKWRAEYFDLKPYLDELLEREDLSVDLTRPNDYRGRTEIVFGGTTVPTTNGIYACGEQNGASFYAERDRRSDQIGLVIEFSVPVSDVLVDGRDFLYNFVFQAPRLSEPQRELVRRAFGARIDHYIGRAFRFEDTRQRIAVCDLAVQNPEVIQEHHRNRLTIQGRYNTQFCSAFLVRVPIPPARIRGIQSSSFEPKTPDLSIATFRNL